MSFIVTATHQSTGWVARYVGGDMVDIYLPEGKNPVFSIWVQDIIADNEVCPRYLIHLIDSSTAFDRVAGRTYDAYPEMRLRAVP